MLHPMPLKVQPTVAVRDELETIRDLLRGALAVGNCFDAKAIASDLVRDAVNVASQLLAQLDGDAQLERAAR